MSRDLEQEIRTLLRAVDEAQVPVTWSEAQSRASRSTVHGMPRSRRPVIVGAALAVAATVAGIAFVTSRSDESGPADTFDPPPVSSTVPGPIASEATRPAVGADAGTLDTPLGLVAWRRLAGAAGEVPVINGGIVVADDGFVAIENPDRFENERSEVSAGVARLWRATASGVWTIESAPFDGAPGFAFLQQVGDEYWLSVSQVFPYRTYGGENRRRQDPAVRERLWKSSDGRAWTEVAHPAGASSPVTLYDVGGALWLADPAGSVWVDHDGTWVERLSGPVRTPPSAGPAWTSDFGEPTTVGDVTMRTVSSASPRWNALQVRGPDGATTWVTPPWGGLQPQDEFYRLDANLMVARGQFVAVVSRLSDDVPNRLETWTSADGIDWAGPFPLVVEGNPEWWDDGTVGDRIALSLSTDRGPEFWYSDDGREWRPGGPQGRIPGRFESWAGGGVLLDGRGSLWFTADLVSWDQVDLGELGISGSTTAGTADHPVDDGIYVLEQEVDGSPSYWVLTVDGGGG